MPITLYHIPVCPFSQRLEILMKLKGLSAELDFQVVDITKERDPELLKKTRGTTALPVLETPDGKILKESLVLMQYLEDLFPEMPIAQQDPYRRAVENMLTQFEGDFCRTGYLFVMNQDESQRATFEAEMLKSYAKINAFLEQHAPDTIYLFEDFGWAEAVFTPFMMRFWFLAYYENFKLPDSTEYRRVQKWQEACLAHPAAQQVTREEIIKLYYDYALGAGNGALPESRTRSSFVFEPHWSQRPWPPREKYKIQASDQALGLL